MLPSSPSGFVGGDPAEQGKNTKERGNGGRKGGGRVEEGGKRVRKRQEGKG